MSQAVTMEPSSTNRANAATPQAPSVHSSDSGSGEEFAAQLRQADSATERSTTARSERRSSAARPIHAKTARRPNDSRPGDGPTASADNQASAPATDRTGSAAGSPGTADGSVQPLVADASGDATTGAVSGATDPTTDATRPTATDPTATDPTNGDPTGGPIVAASAASSPGPQAGSAAVTGAPDPATAMIAGAIDQSRPPGTTGRGSVLGEMHGAPLDGRPGAHRAGVARPGLPKGAGAAENYPVISADAPARIDPGAVSGASTDLASALAAAVNAENGAGRAASVSDPAGQSAGVPTVSVVSTVAAAAPVAGSTALGASDGTSAQPGVAGQLAASLQSLRGREDGVHVLTVRLHPDELGPVRVVARMTGNDVQLRVTTSTVAAAAAVTEAGPRLHDALAGAGLSATGVSVDHDAGLAQQFGQGAGASDPRAGAHHNPGHPGHPGHHGDRIRCPASRSGDRCRREHPHPGPPTSGGPIT